MSIPLAIASAGSLYGTYVAHNHLNAASASSNIYDPPRIRVPTTNKKPVPGTPAEAEHYGYTEHKRRKKGTHYYVAPHPHKRNRFVLKKFTMPRRYRSKRRRSRRRRRAHVVDVTKVTKATANHFLRGQFMLNGEGGRAISSDGSFQIATTYGQMIIPVERLLRTIGVGTNAAINDAFSTENTLQPTNHSNMTAMFNKYTVRNCFISVRFTNTRARPTLDGKGIGDADPSGGVDLSSPGIPIYVGGFIDDTEWLTNATTLSAAQRTVDDPWLHPMGKARTLLPGESTTLTWRISPHALHGKFDINDNDLDATSNNTRGQHPTNLRVFCAPYCSSGNNTSNNIPRYCHVDVKIYKKATWHDKKDDMSFDTL